MASYAAVPVWSPIAAPSLVDPQSAGSVRLTRRGRQLRTLLLLAVLVASLVVGVARVAGQPARAESTPAAPVSTARVVVQEGDSLWLIAERAAPATDPRDVVEAMRSLNGLRSNLIQPGQVLLVPRRA
jgi:nucleoid-associated protein YgaU